MRVGRGPNRNRSGIFNHDQRNLHQSSRTECRIMVKAPAFLLLSLALAGWAVAPQAHLASDPAFTPARFAWDGAGGEDPNRSRSVPEPSHAARTAASERDGIDADQDAKVKRSL